MIATATKAMTSKTYDYKALIEAYIATKRSSVHSDFNNYYDQLFKKLSEFFQITFTESEAKRSVWGAWIMVFNATVRSYLAIQTPLSGFLEMSIRDVADAYQKYGGDKISQLAGENQKLHFDLLCGIFNEVYGESDKVVTSADLLSVGFDDSKEPKIQDYYDYL